MENIEQMVKNAMETALKDETDKLIEEKTEEIRKQLCEKRNEIAMKLAKRMVVQQRMDPRNENSEIVIMMR